MLLELKSLTVAAGIALAASSPAMALAQHAGTAAQRQDNGHATADLRARIGTTEARVAKAERSRKITPARATALRRQIVQVRRSMTSLAAQQGFVSAAELASYNRALGGIDTELDGRGVERGYGKDMLPASRKH